ncbi:hypothetical protein [Bacillus testis]|nr:hypothetical protein [Bacillus testis]
MAGERAVDNNKPYLIAKILLERAMPLDVVAAITLIDKEELLQLFANES